MIDRLPDELVLAIVEELVASQFRGPGQRPLEDLSVREALSMVCLASRRLRKIAQPVLWRQIIVGEDHSLERVFGSGAASSFGKHTRCYSVEWNSNDKTLDCGTILGVADGMPNIVELGVAGRGFNLPKIDLQLLPPHEHLRRLALDNVHLRYGPVPALPHLEQLSMTRCRQRLSDTQSWLCPSHMPSLRVLRVVRMSRRRTPILLHELNAGAIFAQLDVVCIASRDLPRDPPSVQAVELVQAIAPPVLVSHDWWTTGSLPRHMLFSVSNPYLQAHDKAKELVDMVNDALVTFAVSPSVLVVPESFLKYSAASPALVAALQGLEAQLATKGARVIWYDDDYPHDFVPPEFLRYARELKAARRDREEAGRA